MHLNYRKIWTDGEFPMHQNNDGMVINELL